MILRLFAVWCGQRHAYRLRLAGERSTICNLSSSSWTIFGYSALGKHPCSCHYLTTVRCADVPRSGWRHDRRVGPLSTTRLRRCFAGICSGAGAAGLGAGVAHFVGGCAGIIVTTLALFLGGSYGTAVLAVGYGILMAVALFGPRQGFAPNPCQSPIQANGRIAMIAACCRICRLHRCCHPLQVQLALKHASTA